MSLTHRQTATHQVFRVWRNCALLSAALLGGCAGSGIADSKLQQGSPRAAMAIVDDVSIQDGVVEFPPMSAETQQDILMISDRFAVTSIAFDAKMGLHSVSIQLSTVEDLPWTSMYLQEIVLGPTGTVDSWLEADPSASECQLHAEVNGSGLISLSCLGGCPADFPIFSLTPVTLPNGGKTQFFCLCKRLVAE